MQRHKLKLSCRYWQEEATALHLKSYDLFSTIHFPTRNKKNRWNTANNNIFIDTFAFSNFKIIPIINGLSDNDAQLLIIKHLHMCIGTNYMKTIVYIEECSLLEF